MLLGSRGCGPRRELGCIRAAAVAATCCRSLRSHHLGLQVVHHLLVALLLELHALEQLLRGLQLGRHVRWRLRGGVRHPWRGPRTASQSKALASLASAAVGSQQASASGGQSDP